MPKFERNEEKERAWQDRLRELDRVVDGRGEHLDENIKEAVTAFNLNRFPTNSSCGGHPDGGGFPYVMGSPEGKPTFRYVGEEDLVRRMMEEYGTENLRDIYADHGKEFYARVESELGAQESEEHQRWYEKVKPLEVAVGNMLAEFYAERGTPDADRLGLGRVYGHYRVETDAKAALMARVRSNGKVGREEVAQAIRSAQDEFGALTDFLKRRYFAS